MRLRTAPERRTDPQRFKNISNTKSISVIYEIISRIWSHLPPEVCFDITLVISGKNKREKSKISLVMLRILWVLFVSPEILFVTLQLHYAKIILSKLPEKVQQLRRKSEFWEDHTSSLLVSCVQTYSQEIEITPGHVMKKLEVS